MSIERESGGERRMNRHELEEGRRIGHRIYGYKKSYCSQTRSCDGCDRVVAFGCRVIRMIEKLQEKRILRICK